MPGAVDGSDFKTIGTSDMQNFDSLANAQFWKTLQNNLREGKRYVNEAVEWRTLKTRRQLKGYGVEVRQAENEAASCEELARAYQDAAGAQLVQYEAFKRHVLKSNPEAMKLLPLADGSEIDQLDPTVTALSVERILLNAKEKQPEWIHALADLTYEQRILAQAIKESAGGLSYAEMVHVEGAFNDLAPIPSNARTVVKRIRDSWKASGVPFEIPKPKRGGKLQVISQIT
jgi:hypothetical protein